MMKEGLKLIGWLVRGTGVGWEMFLKQGGSAQETKSG